MAVRATGWHCQESPSESAADVYICLLVLRWPTPGDASGHKVHGCLLGASLGVQQRFTSSVFVGGDHCPLPHTLVHTQRTQPMLGLGYEHAQADARSRYLRCTIVRYKRSYAARWLMSTRMLQQWQALDEWCIRRILIEISIRSLCRLHEASRQLPWCSAVSGARASVSQTTLVSDRQPTHARHTISCVHVSTSIPSRSSF